MAGSAQPGGREGFEKNHRPGWENDAWNQRKGTKASHIVSAWSKEDGYSLGQKAVEEKSNGITAIPELLEKI